MIKGFKFSFFSILRMTIILCLSQFFPTVNGWVDKSTIWSIALIESSSLFIIFFTLYFSPDRRVKLISLEGCSLLTTGGLESVLLCWKELQELRVVSCNNISDSDITSALASLFSVLKELTWRPNSRALLSSSLAETGVGMKGGRFFKRLKSWLCCLLMGILPSIQWASR